MDNLLPIDQEFHDRVDLQFKVLTLDARKKSLSLLKQLNSSPTPLWMLSSPSPMSIARTFCASWINSTIKNSPVWVNYFRSNSSLLKTNKRSYHLWARQTTWALTPQKLLVWHTNQWFRPCSVNCRRKRTPARVWRMNWPASNRSRSTSPKNSTEMIRNSVTTESWEEKIDFTKESTIEWI